MRDVRLTYLVSFFLFVLLTGNAIGVDRLKVDVFKVHPTQSMVGSREVLKIKQEMRVLLEEGPKELKAFLKEEIGEIVKGPHQTLWLVDGHHHAKALLELKNEDAGFGSFDFFGEVIEDWSALSDKDFELAMRKGQNGKPYVYLKDSAGQTVPFANLPPSLETLTDFPMRTVAWLLRKAGAIKKLNDYPFQDFVVASLLVGSVEVKSPGDDAAYLVATRKALEILDEASPASFPGLKPFEASDIDSMLRSAEEELAHP